ncbi:MAG TPA: hypothetical protein VK403_14340 [Allosphingosinicella sp.]|nr:hypothetical protein [Allosphingosinicella sp.]
MSEPQAKAPVTTVTVGQAYEAPASVRPIQSRYITCMSNAFNSALRALGRAQTPAELRAMPGQAIRACAGTRADAAAEAESVLSGQMAKGKRARVVEAMLAAAERDLQANAESMASLSESAASGAPRASNLVSQAKLGTFQIPDDLAPALAPYLMCRFASLGVPVYDRGAKSPIRAPRGIGKGSDCGPVRIKAAKDADRMLKRAGGRDRAQRAAYIERVLVSIDEFNPGPPLPSRPPKD